MIFKNASTGELGSIRADLVLSRPDGLLLVESMHSAVVDLSGSPEHVVARIHPAKATLFEWIVTGTGRLDRVTTEESRTLDGSTLNLVPDVELHVNRRDGGVHVRHFAECLDAHRQLLAQGSCSGVRRTTVLPGFDEVEPVAREMSDGSMVLIFAAMPPVHPQAQGSAPIRFNMDTFGDELTKAVGTDVLWDDREVFAILKPGPGCLEALRSFIAGYWNRRKPWWKVW